MRKWLLPASIILNAFLLGAVAAHLYAEPWPPGPMQAMERLGRDLPPADRDLLQSAFAASVDELDRSRVAMDEINRKLHAILVKEPFDKAAFQALLQQSDALRAQFSHALTASLPDVIAKMSPAGRRRMAEMHVLGPPPPPPPRLP